MQANGGGLDVDGALDGIAPEQLDEWMAYERIEPFWFDKLYYQAALIGAVIARSLGAKVKPEDLLLDVDKPQVNPSGSPDGAAAAFASVFGHGNRNR